jgi:hypothetical protein
LALFWDIDARNHDVTLLELRHMRLKESYREGEIPHEARTGTDPVLLTTVWHNREIFLWIGCKKFYGMEEGSSGLQFDSISSKKKL